MGKHARLEDGNGEAVEGTGESELRPIDDDTQNKLAEATKWSRGVQRAPVARPTNAKGPARLSLA